MTSIVRENFIFLFCTPVLPFMYLGVINLFLNPQLLPLITTLKVSICMCFSPKK